MPQIQIVQTHVKKISRKELLDMPFSEFFSFERMCLFDPDNFATARHVWLRIVETPFWSFKKTSFLKDNKPPKTVGEFLDQVTREDLMNIDRVAKGCVDLMELVLDYSGLHLKLTRQRVSNT